MPRELPINLVSTYIHMMAERGISKTRAIRELCDALDRKYSPSYVTDWPTGEKKVPNNVANHLIDAVYSYVQRPGRTKAEQVRMLSVPERRSASR